jgi:formylglycine-generating enzyme
MPEDRLIMRTPNVVSSPHNHGKNYVLAIGINDYKHCPKLNNAVKDVRDFIALIISKYQFETESITTLFDGEATRRGIVRAFHNLAKKITSDDNLIIYFSGHGEFDSVLQQGYWIPVNAEKNEIDDYLPNSTIRDALNAINSHHTLLIADSCFSGTLFSSRDANCNISQRLESESSRWGLTSGRNEIVSDGAPNTNSPFAGKLLHLLTRNEKSLGSAELCARMMEIVAANARQTPRGEPLQIKGHNGGQFFFHLKVAEKSDIETSRLEIQALKKRISELEKSVSEEQVILEIPILNNIILVPFESNASTDFTEPPFEFEPLEIIRFENNLSKIITPPTPSVILPKKFDFEPEMVFVKGGMYKMGSEKYEKPVHNVTLSDFYIGKFPVIQAQWQVIMGVNPSRFKGDNLPVEQVSWADIQTFLEKINTKTSREYRLPTEAEWEFAARGGTKNQGFDYSGSNYLKEVAWFYKKSGGKTHPVGELEPNELGIYDMSGNVQEWCNDWLGEYNSNAITNPAGANTGSARVFRGGSWDSGPFFCRSSDRSGNTPTLRRDDLGFRLAISSLQ